jgi:hypothetical protein
MAKLLVEIIGQDYQIEELKEALETRYAIDLLFPGGHGTNQLYHPMLGMKLAEAT